MANATPSRFGQINGSGATDALFLKVFAGEVLTAFYQQNIFLDKHLVRTISSGKSAQFPVTGRASGAAALHTPGVEITGSTVGSNERVILIDGLLLTSRFVGLIDELETHYDVRSIYSADMGNDLAVAFDTQVASCIILAARASAAVTGEPAGTVVSNSLAATDGDTLASMFFSAAQNLDTKRVPAMDRYGALAPAQYYLLAQTKNVINRDWAGAGSYSEGTVKQIGGIPIFKSLSIPSTNVTTGVSTYQGDFTKTVGCVWQKQAAGTVKLLDLSVETQWDIRRQGSLMVAKYAMGHGILRAEAAVEIATP
jgi:hypothetical protein